MEFNSCCRIPGITGFLPFPEKNFQDFSRTLKFTLSLSLPVCHTFHVFYLSLTDFQNFPGPEAFFQDFPVLENATIKFQDFPGFPGPVQTLFRTRGMLFRYSGINFALYRCYHEIPVKKTTDQN